MDKLAFPNLSLSEKRNRLLKHNMDLNQRDRVGLLGDLLIEGKIDAQRFLSVSGGPPFVYKEIGLMTSKFPLEFLVDFFSQPKIPIKEIDWKRYFWGAAWKSYHEWSARKAEEIHLTRKREEEPLSFLHRLIGEGGAKWKGSAS